MTNERALTVTRLVHNSVTYYNLSQCHQKTINVRADIGDVILNDRGSGHHWADRGFVAARDFEECMQIIERLPKWPDVTMTDNEPCYQDTTIEVNSHSISLDTDKQDGVLEPNEHVIWTGRPGVISLIRRDSPIYAISAAILFGCGFGGWKCLTESIVPGIVGCLFGAMFVVVLTVSLLLRALSEWMHDSYIVTTSRVGIVSHSKNKMRVRWVMLRQLPRIRRRENRWGGGDIILANVQRKDTDGNNLIEEIGIWGISNVRDVWNRIMLQLRTKGQLSC